mmetsp:Transcript_15978/g.47979  ORF Transcript_15978/g.47979 Transcript_15978/m.47979 type:complete len:225 (+) Transcript_15978:182-856(+)
MSCFRQPSGSLTSFSLPSGAVMTTASGAASGTSSSLLGSSSSLSFFSSMTARRPSAKRTASCSSRKQTTENSPEGSNCSKRPILYSFWCTSNLQWASTKRVPLPNSSPRSFSMARTAEMSMCVTGEKSRTTASTLSSLPFSSPSSLSSVQMAVLTMAPPSFCMPPQKVAFSSKGWPPSSASCCRRLRMSCVAKTSRFAKWIGPSARKSMRPSTTSAFWKRRRLR